MQIRLLLLAFISICAQAQPQNATWYFGHYAGLKFDSLGSPTALTDGAMTTRSNSTCISDSTGNILLYSDGARVYNQNHQMVLHGDSLYSSWMPSALGYFGGGAIYGSVLLPSFEDDDSYVLFTPNPNVIPTFPVFTPGLVMNKISVSGDSVVLPKNQMVFTTTDDSTKLSYRIAAIRHANGRDWWLITHHFYGSTFAVFLYDPWGVHGPYDQEIGSHHTAPDFLGQTSVNRDGTKLILSSGTGIADVFDFDRCTGLLSNFIELGFPPYNSNMPSKGGHAEFSANSQIAYVSNTTNLYQYDLTAPNPKLTETIVYTNPYSNAPLTDSTVHLGEMKLGLDDHIYIALYPLSYLQDSTTHMMSDRTTYLGVINSPNSLGTVCDVVPDGFYLGGKNSSNSLPNSAYHLGPLVGSGCDTIVPQTLPSALFTSDQTSLCEGSCVQFTNQSTGAASYQWFFPFGTPASSLDSVPPPVCYAQDGSYPVTLVVTNPDGSDTLVQNNFITVHPGVTNIIPYLANDTQFTVGQFVSYQWFKDSVLVSNDSFCLYAGDGLYSVIVSNENGCTGQANYLVTKATSDPSPFAFTVSPNPASQKVICSWSNADVVTVELYDLLGQKITTFLPHSTSVELDLRKVTKGVYLVRAVDRNGWSASRRLVVE